jgi:hypothetical protein
VGPHVEQTITFLAPVCLIVVLHGHEGPVWCAHLVRSRFALAAVLSMPLGPRRSDGELNLVKVAVSAPRPDPAWLRHYRGLAKDYD